MKLYRVKDWDSHFENDRSRTREKCSFVCVPNKQHGMGFSYLMREKDGAAMYGIWHCIIGACSQQKKPRTGLLTSNGELTGSAWGAADLSVKFRRSETEIVRALEFLSSDKVGWLEYGKLSDGKLLIESHREVTVKSPDGHLEEKRREEKERSEWVPSILMVRFNKLFKRRDSTKWSAKETEALNVIGEPAEEDLSALERYYTATIQPAKDYRRRDLITLLNNFNGEIDRARKWAQGAKEEKPW